MSARDVIRQSLARFPESTRLVWRSPPDGKYIATTYVPRQGMPGDIIELIFIRNTDEDIADELDGKIIKLFGLGQVVSEGRCKFLLEGIWHMANSHPLWEPTLVVYKGEEAEAWQELPED